uniref:Uncharacterized protein n=1 Tax=Rhizophora mucronata TaxID=61149 RepID=A0A2P2NM80_RHIMU
MIFKETVYRSKFFISPSRLQYFSVSLQQNRENQQCYPKEHAISEANDAVIKLFHLFPT